MDSTYTSETRNKVTMETLSTQMAEGLAVRFSEEELQRAGEEFTNSLAVKLIGNRGFNRTTFKTVLRELWKPTGSLKFTEIEGNILIAKFYNASDRDKVISRGPWRFMGWAVQIEKWVAGKQITELFTEKLQLWVQIHNLPVEYRNKHFALRFAEKPGIVIRMQIQERMKFLNT